MTWRCVRRRSGVAMLAVAALALTGCGSGGAAGNDGKPAQSTEADPNATLRFTSAAPIRNLDPALQTSYGGVGYLVLAIDRLTTLDKDDNVVPGLATEWKFAKDGSYLELKLRDDVRFHDGTVFDAAAVKANIERGKTLEGSTIKQNLDDITSVEAVDAHTVRLRLVKGRGVQLPSVFATNAGMMISPKAIAERSAKLASDLGDAGSGPYLVTSFTPGEKVVMKKAPAYWDPAVGQIAGIELQAISDGATRLRGVQTGQTDLTTVSAANDLAQARQLADQGAVDMKKVTFRNVLGVYLRANLGDLTKPEVRQAIAHAIDPDAVGALFSGSCQPNRQLYPAGSWAAIKDYSYPYPYDQAKARELVQKAGGAKVTISYPASTNMEQPANVIQGKLSEAGIDAKLNPVPNTENEPRFIAGDFELMVSASWSPKIDPADTVDTYLLDTYKLATDRGAIEPDAAKAADPTLSEAQRAPLYAKIWQTTMQQAWYIPICRLTVGVVSNNKVLNTDNVPLADIGIWDLRHIAVKR
ncbi:ABC transporter substrate-binding protein [Streptosporangium carneum]|uniref:ABC transporter substrate-binding protein n=1 Tax=Streptosporangium carneum TaxID=47481 RepID=A0A9W6I735_9ACTN|nr:ABC transporter substrate-binding protein [Streptosporangium carneum]GLK12606.1 ABC transporter substrate-binding protein [Streptosporangium carneum]